MIGPRSGPMPHQAVSALTPGPGARIWLAAGLTDMRRGFDGLTALVQQHLGKDPFSGQIFIFRGRRGRLRLVGSFQYPRRSSATCSITHVDAPSGEADRF